MGQAITSFINYAYQAQLRHFSQKEAIIALSEHSTPLQNILTL
jgi:hypothetical protein